MCSTGGNLIRGCASRGTPDQFDGDAKKGADRVIKYRNCVKMIVDSRDSYSIVPQIPTASRPLYFPVAADLWWHRFGCVAT